MVDDGDFRDVDTANWLFGSHLGLAAEADLPAALSAWLARNEVAPGSLYDAALAALERPLFEHALARTGGNQLQAAALLGINRNTLRKRLTELSIDPERFSAAN